MSNTALWTAVEASYDSGGLIALTNYSDRSATTINTTQGQNAAQAAINLFPIYAQVAYDATDATHVEVAKFATIAILWERGGTSTTIARVKMEDVFSPEGMVARIRRTDPRGHRGPSTNSGLQASRENDDGKVRRPWSDRKSMPPGFLPTDTPVSES